VGGMTCLPLAAHRKVQEDRRPSRKGWLALGTQESHDLFRSQNMLMLGKHALERQPRVTGQPSAEEISCLAHRSTQPSQQKLGMEWGHPEKIWETLLSKDMGPCDIHGRPTRCMRTSYPQRNHQLGGRDRDRTQRGKAVRILGFFRQEKG